MCVDFCPASESEIAEMMEAEFPAAQEWKHEVWEDYAAPFVRSTPSGDLELIVGNYGFRPQRFRKEGEKRRSTMNARAETIGIKPTYAKSWRESHLCLVPATCFFEPKYVGGKSERWGIGMADESPFAVAGMWRGWIEDDVATYAFTQITINADNHPLMSQFHREFEEVSGVKQRVEKRSLVVVPRSKYRDWLNCKNPEVAKNMLQLYPAELMRAWPAPKEKRVKATKSKLDQPDIPTTGSLF